MGITQAGGNSGDTISISPTRRLGLRRYETFAGTTEGPRRVRQLDGAFLFGHERIVAHADRAAFLGIASGLAVNRPWAINLAMVSRCAR